MKPGSAEWSCAFFCLFTAQGHPPIFGVWCLCSPDPPAAKSSNCSVGCSPSSSTLFGGKLCITVLQNLCFPGCRLSSARDPHYGPRSTTSLHGDGDGFLPSSGWHFLQHLPSVRPVTAVGRSTRNRTSSAGSSRDSQHSGLPTACPRQGKPWMGSVWHQWEAG